MKFINNQYKFDGKDNFRIIVLSDIHFSYIFNLDILTEIKNYIIKEKADYICMPGDIIDGEYCLNDSNRNTIFLDWFKELGKIAPTIISLGNHDFKCENKKVIKHNFFFSKLEKINNVHLLDNKEFEDKKVKIVGYTSIIDYYDQKINNDEYIKDIDKTFSFKDKSKYNIILCHSPRNISKKEIVNKLKLMDNADLVLSGHMHNGMHLPIIDKIYKGNIGIISPRKKPFPNCARGHIKRKKNNNEINFVISGGITKLSEKSPKVLHKFNKLYQPHIETIDIIKK